MYVWRGLFRVPLLAAKPAENIHTVNRYHS